MAEGTLTLPAIGEVKRQHAVIGAAAVAGIAGVVWIRRGQAAAEEVPAALDEPEAYAGDYAAGVDAYVNPGGSTVIGSPASEIDPDSLPPASNPAWTIRAVSKLSDVGWDPMVVTGALARYLGHQEQADAMGVEVVRAALAMVGPPPNGEFSIRMPTTPAAPSGSTPTPTPVPAAPAAPAPLRAPSGFKVKSVGRTSVSLVWSAVPGAKSYLIARSGTSHQEPSSLDNSETINGLKSGTKYTFTIRAVDANGVRGPASGAVTATTKK